MAEIGDIEVFVVQALAEVTQLPPETIWDHHRVNVFREFDLDELLALDLVETLEERFRIELPVDRLDELVSVDGAVALVKSILRAASSAAAS